MRDRNACGYGGVVGRDRIVGMMNRNGRVEGMWGGQTTREEEGV